MTARIVIVAQWCVALPGLVVLLTGGPRRLAEAMASIGESESMTEEEWVELRRELQRTGNRSSLAALLMGFVLGGFFAWNRLVRYGLGLGQWLIGVTFIVHFVLIFNTGVVAVTIMKLLRVQVILQANLEQALLGIRWILRLCVGVFIAVTVISIAGLVPFFAFLSAVDNPNWVISPVAIGGIATLLLMDTWWTLNIWRMGVRQEPFLHVLRARWDEHPWKRYQQNVAHGDESVWGERKSRPLILICSVSILLFLAIAAWLFIFTIVAGPPEIINNDNFFVDQRAYFPAQPATWIVILLFSPVFGGISAAYVLLPSKITQWPQGTLSRIGLAAGAVSLVQIARFWVYSFILTGLVGVICLTILFFSTRWVFVQRPTWRYTRPVLYLGLASLGCGVIVGYIIFPIFTRSSNSVRVLLRFLVEAIVLLVTIVLEIFTLKTLKNSTLRRPYVPLATVTPIIIFGRFMVTGVDNLLGQLNAVILLGAVEVFSVCLLPYVLLVLNGLRPGLTREALCKTIELSNEELESDVKAFAAILRPAAEHAGIFLSTITILFYAFIWYPDDEARGGSLGKLAKQLAISAGMQFSVELVVDFAALHIRTRAQGTRFVNRDFLRPQRIALVSAILASVVLMILSLPLLVLARDIIDIVYA